MLLIKQCWCFPLKCLITGMLHLLHFYFQTHKGMILTAGGSFHWTCWATGQHSGYVNWTGDYKYNFTCVPKTYPLSLFISKYFYKSDRSAFGHVNMVTKLNCQAKKMQFMKKFIICKTLKAYKPKYVSKFNMSTWRMKYPLISNLLPIQFSTLELRSMKLF